MPTTTINPPSTFAQHETAGLTYSYVLARQALLEALMDKLDPIATGMVSLKGDVAGTMSDTIRIREVDDIGFARRFSALANSTDGISASAFTLGYTEVSVGIYGLAHEEDFHGQVLGSNGGVSLDDLIRNVPGSLLATLRYLACVTGATISSTVGSASTYLSVDDALDLATEIRSTPGAADNGPIRVTTDPAAIDKLIRSARTEPAFQNSAADFAALLGIKAGQIYPNLLGLGMDWLGTDDTQQSGGGYQGFAASFGGVGWARASTGAIRPSGMGRAMYMPEFGLFIQEIDRGENGKARYEARAWLGTALGSSNVFFQRRLISKV
jgi:hypothetical protein